MSPPDGVLVTTGGPARTCAHPQAWSTQGSLLSSCLLKFGQMCPDATVASCAVFHPKNCLSSARLFLRLIPSCLIGRVGNKGFISAPYKQEVCRSIWQTVGESCPQVCPDHSCQFLPQRHFPCKHPHCSLTQGARKPSQRSRGDRAISSRPRSAIWHEPCSPLTWPSRPPVGAWPCGP